jgi:hypothetical protein
MPDDPTAGRGARAGLFRPAAVAAHTAAAGPGRQLPSSRRALDRAGAGLALVLAIALSVASIVEVDETAEGRWTRQPGAGVVTVIVPVGALPRLRAGQDVTLGAGRHAVVAGRAEAVRTAAGDGAAAVVTAALSGPPGDAASSGRAVVRLDRRRLIGLVGDALGRGFGRG